MHRHSVATCVAGHVPSRSPQPFSPSALQRLKSASQTTQAEAVALAAVFCSPTGTSGLPVTPAGSSLPSCRFAPSPGHTKQTRSMKNYSPRPFPVSGRNTAFPPVACRMSGGSCLSLIRHSPSGCCSLRILAFQPRRLSFENSRQRPAKVLAGWLTITKRPISLRSL